MLSTVAGSRKADEHVGGAVPARLEHTFRERELEG